MQTCGGYQKFSKPLYSFVTFPPCFLSSGPLSSPSGVNARSSTTLKRHPFRLRLSNFRRKSFHRRRHVVTASSTSVPGFPSRPDDSSPSTPSSSQFQPFSIDRHQKQRQPEEDIQENVEHQEHDNSEKGTHSRLKEHNVSQSPSTATSETDATTAAAIAAPSAFSSEQSSSNSSYQAALQVDDGSLTGVSLVMPRPLYRKKPEFRNTLEQLRRGFDTGTGATIWLMCLFASWYGSNTMFNVYNKQILKVFPFPITCTVVQFLVAGLIMGSLWVLRMKRPPKFSKTLLQTAFPLAVFHGAGFLLTNMSLGKVSVAFTHTVKSTEPFFSVALTPSILGEVPTWGIIGSLFPIVAGVALASATDVSFNWPGFLSALGSNIALQSRNVLSKKLISQNNDPTTSKALENLDNINLFAVITILAFALFGPLCAMSEGFRFTSVFTSQAVTGMPQARLYGMLLLGGICRCIDVLSSYMILQRVSPVTHSVGNCVKRAVVIVVSIIFFKTTMQPLNIVGTCLALLGVLAYSIIVSACKQNKFGPDSPFCKPIYELELTEGGGI